MAGPLGGHDLLYNSTQVYSEGSGMGWTNSVYRNIKITKDAHVSPVFYNWFMANATAIPKLSSVLVDNSWADIALAADLSIGQNYWSVGDTKSITINGKIGNTNISQTINAFIIGFNHNSGKEGNNRIHFLIGKSGDNMCGMTDSNYNTRVSATGWCSRNTSNTNSGGWNNSYMRKTLLGNTGTPIEPVEKKV